MHLQAAVNHIEHRAQQQPATGGQTCEAVVFAEAKECLNPFLDIDDGIAEDGKIDGGRQYPPPYLVVDERANQ